MPNDTISILSAMHRAVGIGIDLAIEILEANNIGGAAVDELRTLSERFGAGDG